MQSLTTSKRRKRLLKSHASPSILYNNNSTELDRFDKQEGSVVSVDRLPLANNQFDGISYPVTLTRETKFHSTKLSRLKVLLSPRNPYEEFHKLFAEIPKNEFPINDYSCALSRDILLHGRLFVSQNWLCFYSNIFGFETVVKLELRKVKTITRAKTAYMFPNAILVWTEKKKYLFCSFLMRDAAHKLLSTVWQESTNNKPDSGVDEVNGEPDEEEYENLDETAEYTETKIAKLPINLTQELQPPKDAALLRCLGKHHRTVSCPNTPLSHHPSLSEEQPPELTTVLAQLHQKGHPSHKRSLSISAIRKHSTRITRVFYSLFKHLYNCVSPLAWLLRRNRYSAEAFLLLSSFFLIFLLISTYVLLNRIAHLEDRFQSTLPGSNADKHLITDQKSGEKLTKLLKHQARIFRQKTERFKQVLSSLLLSIENVQSKLKVIKDELEDPTVFIVKAN